jgi:hypothetical protein
MIGDRHLFEASGASLYCRKTEAKQETHACAALYLHPGSSRQRVFSNPWCDLCECIGDKGRQLTELAGSDTRGPRQVGPGWARNCDSR